MTNLESTGSALPPTLIEMATAVIGLAAWTGVYCGARLIGGTVALLAWGIQATARVVRRLP